MEKRAPSVPLSLAYAGAYLLAASGLGVLARLALLTKLHIRHGNAPSPYWLLVPVSLTALSVASCRIVFLHRSASGDDKTGLAAPLIAYYGLVFFVLIITGIMITGLTILGVCEQ